MTTTDYLDSWNRFANRFGDFNGLRAVRRVCKSCGKVYFIDRDEKCPECNPQQ